MSSFTVVLRGGSPWGLRIKGGREFNEPITISKINPNSKAYNEGILVGDVITEINRQKTHGLNYNDAQQLIKNSTDQLVLNINRVSQGGRAYINGGIPASSPGAQRAGAVNAGGGGAGGLPASRVLTMATGHRHQQQQQQHAAFGAPRGQRQDGATRSQVVDRGDADVVNAANGHPASPPLATTTSTTITTPSHSTMATSVSCNSADAQGLSQSHPRYKGAITVPQLSPTLPRSAARPIPRSLSGPVHDQPFSQRSPQPGSLESRWSEQAHYEQGGPASPMWSKRPIMQPASPKPMRHNVPKPMFASQPFSSYGAAGPGRQGQVSPGYVARHSPAHSPLSPKGPVAGATRASSVGRGSSAPGDVKSPSDVKSRGMNLFRRQQEKLAQLGADVQEINIGEEQAGLQHHPPYSVQSSPGGTGVYVPSRSYSVDEGERTVPIIVQSRAAPGAGAGGSFGPEPLHPTPRRGRSNSESTETFHTRPTHDSGFSSWQSGLSDHGARSFGVGSYATLPAKPLSAHSHTPRSLPTGTGPASLPTSQPLSVEADQPINDFDYHIYSTLPTIKPLRSHSHRLPPLDLPELERERKFQDYSRPLWTNTDLPGPPQPGDDTHSPPSDNAVSSSDSRDTIIARSDDTKSTLQETQSAVTDSKPEPTMIPVRVVHEDMSRGHIPGRSPSAPDRAPDMDSMEPLWGKRVVEGADQSLSSTPSEPSRTVQEKPPEPLVNGLKSPSYTSSSKPGVWSPGFSPAQFKPQQPPRTEETSHSPSSPPESSLKNIAPVWKPSGSPGGARKEYRPVRLNTAIKPAPKPGEKQARPQESDVKPEESYAWKPSRPSESDDRSRVPTSALSYTPMSTSDSFTPMSTSDRMLVPDAQPVAVSVLDDALREQRSRERSTAGHPRTNGSVSDSVFGDGKDEESRLPSTQSPYITLLQKSRENETQGDLNFNHIGSKKPIVVTSEGQLPKGAQYLGQKVTVEGDQKHTDTYYAIPTKEETTTTKTVEHRPIVYEGIGPVDKEGVPLAFRKNVDETKQHDWYRQMYKSLHRTEKKEDRLGINDMIDSIFEKAEENKYRPTYKFPDDISDTKSEEDFAPYRPSHERSSSLKDDSGYRSEPEGRYKDLMRRSRSTSERETRDKEREPRRNFSTSVWAPASVRSRIEVYRNQPRSIMDYEPGFSSIALREAKTGNQHNPPIDKPGQFSQYIEGSPRHAAQLDARQSGDGADPRDLYRQVQSGGDIPARGLQKPAPEKPPGGLCVRTMCAHQPITITVTALPAG